MHCCTVFSRGNDVFERKFNVPQAICCCCCSLQNSAGAVARRLGFNFITGFTSAAAFQTMSSLHRCTTVFDAQFDNTERFGEEECCRWFPGWYVINWLHTALL